MAITGISLSTYSNLSGVVLHPNVRVRAMSAMDSPQPASAVTPTAANVVPLPVEKQPPPSFTPITNMHLLSSAILPNPLRPSTSTSHYRRGECLDDTNRFSGFLASTARARPCDTTYPFVPQRPGQAGLPRRSALQYEGSDAIPR